MPGLGDAIRHSLVIILAGGRGSRLKQLTDAVAKPAIPFAGKFRIIDFPLSNCVNSGLRRIGVVTQYEMHTLIQHVQAGWGFLRAEFNEFIQIWPAQQTKLGATWYQGTADAVFQNIELINQHKPRYVIILGGDHVYKQDYSRLLDDHIRQEADLSISCIAVTPKEATEFGVMEVEADGRIVRFLEKPENPPTMPDNPDKCLASMGIYIFNAELLSELLVRDAADAASSHDFGKDLIPFMVPRFRVYAHEFAKSCIGPPGTEPYWRDVGTVDAYWEASMDLVSVTPDLDLYDHDWPIWTFQPQRPSAKFVFDSDNRRGMAVDSLISGGCIVSGSLVRRSLLYTDCRVNSYCTIESSVLLPGCDIGRESKLRKVIVGQGCRIPPGTVVGFDPKEDGKRFYRTQSGVILITPDDARKLNEEKGNPVFKPG
ncbi:MAG: glucose-1-phosphate adenylyltransferase [Magnetococcales bacterium]|nr:glucose-1-phosphate adenylyltransferase [Magnetococcales bacterium]MBF0156127.1 glucose-1-phosphate adenylyltransferase [Magnetococcales bacterium]